MSADWRAQIGVEAVDHAAVAHEAIERVATRMAEVTVGLVAKEHARLVATALQLLDVPEVRESLVALSGEGELDPLLRRLEVAGIPSQRTAQLRRDLAVAHKAKLRRERGTPGLPQPAGPSPDHSASVPDTGPTSPRGKRTRPTILVSGDLAVDCDAALAALAEHCAGVDLFERGGAIVEIEADPDAGSRIRELTRGPVHKLLADSAEWLTGGRNGEPSPCPPPESVVRFVVETRQRGLRRLRGAGLLLCPTILEDGQLLTEPGYDPASGLYLVNSLGRPVGVSPEPTEADARSALAVLIEPFRDFRFVEECHRSAAIAAVLTAVAPDVFTGNSPIFTTSAASHEGQDGKGLLANVIAIIATGRKAPARGYGKNDEETEKAILTSAVEGRRIICFDNVDRPFGGAVIDRAVTSADFYEGRILGASKLYSGPLRVLWLANGCNLRLAPGQTARRCIPILLHPRPAGERQFAHDPLEDWVLANRAELVSAALTILRAHHLAGRPRSPDLDRMNSFESWDGRIRAALVWLGLPDPRAGRSSFAAVADDAALAFRRLLQNWFDELGPTPVTGDHLKRIATRSAHNASGDLEFSSAVLRDSLAAFVGIDPDDVHFTTRLGCRLRDKAGCSADGLMLVQGDLTHRARLWSVHPSGGGGQTGEDARDASSSPGHPPLEE